MLTEDTNRSFSLQLEKGEKRKKRRKEKKLKVEAKFSQFKARGALNNLLIMLTSFLN